MKISDELREWADIHCNEECREYLGLLADRIDREMVELSKDADGVPIRIGDEMNVDGDAMTVLGYRLHNDMLLLIAEDKKRGLLFTPEPSRVHHFKPEPADSLERIADELDEWRVDAAGDCRIKATDEDIVHDLAERIRKLAEKEDV